MKQTPYNTGKVLIGSRYEPPKPAYNDPNSEFWQGVLLGDHRYKRKQRIWFGIYLVALLLVFALMAGFK